MEQPTNNNDQQMQQVQTLTPNLPSISLMSSMAINKIEPQKRDTAEIVINPAQMTMVGRAVMPKGVPDIDAVKHYPSIVKLVEDFGEPIIIKALFLLIQNYCATANVVRNMNAAQMMDTAMYLLDECDSCRLEDYYIMFQMAKRDKFVINDGKGIMDRMDITIITQIHKAYLNFRADEMIRLRDERDHRLRMERLNNTQKQITTGEKTFVHLPEGYISNETAKLKETIKAVKNEQYEDFLKRSDERKKQMLKEAAAKWKISPEQLFNEVQKEKERLVHVKQKQPKPKVGQIILDNVVPLEPKKKKDMST